MNEEGKVHGVSAPATRSGERAGPIGPSAPPPGALPAGLGSAAHRASQGAPAGPSIDPDLVLDKVPEWHDAETIALLEVSGASRRGAPASLLETIFGFEARPGLPLSLLLAGDLLAVGSLLAGCTVTAVTMGPAGLLITVAMEAMAAAVGGALIAQEGPEPGQGDGLPDKSETLALLSAHFQAATRSEIPLALLLLQADRASLPEPPPDPRGQGLMLQALAARASSALRAGDQLGREGEERLLVILPGLDTLGATLVAERIRLAVASSPVPLEEGSQPITVSLGVAATDQALSPSLRDLIKRAAVALYRAGVLGRNRVVVAGPSLKPT